MLSCFPQIGLDNTVCRFGRIWFAFLILALVRLTRTTKSLVSYRLCKQFLSLFVFVERCRESSLAVRQGLDNTFQALLYLICSLFGKSKDNL